jgi:hypothetical protein
MRTRIDRRWRSPINAKTKIAPRITGRDSLKKPVLASGDETGSRLA